MVKLKEEKTSAYSLTAHVGKTLGIVYEDFYNMKFIKFRGEWRTDTYGIPYITVNQIDETIEALQAIKQRLKELQ